MLSKTTKGEKIIWSTAPITMTGICGERPASELTAH